MTWVGPLLLNSPTNDNIHETILLIQAVCWFIRQVAPARRQRSDIFGLRVKLPPVTTTLTTQRYRNLVKSLAQGHNKRTCRPSPH